MSSHAAPRALLWLLAALVARPALAQRSTRVAPPEVAAISVTPLLARFYWADCGEDCFDRSWRAWTFSRTTDTWGSLGPRPTAPTIPSKQPAYEPAKSVRLDGAFRLAYSRSDARGPVFSVVSTADKRRFSLRPAVSAAERWRAVADHRLAVRSLTKEPPHLSTAIRTWATSADAIWFGLQGHYTAPGGLLRFDRKTHRVEAIVDPMISTATVVEMAASRAAVWVAVDTNYGGMSRRGTGILRYDRAARSWRRLTAQNSPLPDDDVLTIAATGDTVWVATRTGVAVLDDASGRWSVRHARVAAAIDSVTESIPATGHTDEDGVRRWESDARPVIVARWELTERPAPDDSRERAIVALGRVLRPVPESSPFAVGWLETVVDPDSFVATLRSVPVAHFDSAWGGDELVVERALAHPRLVRFAAATIHVEEHGGTSWDSEVVGALGWAGDPAYLPTLRELATAASEPGPSVAFALARLGDTIGTAMLRTWLARGLSGYGAGEIRNRLIQLGDTTIVPWLAAREEYGAARQVATRAQWHALVRDALARPSAATALLYTARWSGVDAVASDAESRALLARLARAAFAAPPPPDSASYVEREGALTAAQVLAALRDTAAVPELIAGLADARRYAGAMVALIEMTGADDCPAPPAPTAEERDVARRFWAAWWDARRATFVPASQDAGLAALRRWRERWVPRG